MRRNDFNELSTIVRRCLSGEDTTGHCASRYRRSLIHHSMLAMSRLPAFFFLFTCFVLTPPALTFELLILFMFYF